MESALVPGLPVLRGPGVLIVRVVWRSRLVAALEALKSATYLVVAWFPLAVALSPAGRLSSQNIIWKILTSICGVCCVAVAVDLWGGGLSGRNVGAVAMAATGSFLLARMPRL